MTSAPGPHTPPRSEARASRLQSGEFEQLVGRSLMLLERGKGHTAVINELRAFGMGHDEAKRESVAVFEEARRRLRRGQRFPRGFAWFLIGLGIVLPLFMLLSGIGFVLISSAPLAGGMGILYKLPNPKALPMG